LYTAITGSESIRPAVEAKAKASQDRKVEEDKKQLKRFFTNDGTGNDKDTKPYVRIIPIP
jgi:hypothetical protein